MMDASGSAPSLWRRIWKVGRIALVVILLLYIGLVIYRIPAVHEKYVSDETVKQIQATKLTMESVDGKHLPSPPDPTEADATLGGVDANQNGIRDDVELAIFKKYPNDIKLRAAELQYALALQMYLTEVFTSDTLVAVIHQDERGTSCINDTVPKPSSSASDAVWSQHFSEEDARQIEVETLVFSNKERMDKYHNVFHQFMTSYAEDKSTNHCDVQI